ncbi:16S rRNA methyltransferase [Candidatus Bathyarchaeota archaeon]|nr:MAG: 16S rRNA methyltransferase [Candidatus Bathyarchaeota archaeon]
MTWLERLAGRHGYSVDVIRTLHKVYGYELEPVLHALKSPGRFYHLRVNTLKTSRGKVLDSLREKGVEAEPHPLLPDTIRIPIEGPNTLPEAEKTIVVDKFTAESALMGANVYVPGVKDCRGLRRGDLVAVADEVGEVVAVGVSKMSEKEVLSRRKGLVVENTHPLYSLPPVRELSEYRNGLVYPQSCPSILAVHVLNPKPGETLVDLTCAPGGKLSHAYQLMRGEGEIIGVDRSRKKIAQTRRTLSRLGFHRVKLLSADSRYLDVDYGWIRADKCIVDPPCSALGVMPKLYEQKTRGQILSLADYQRQFLKVAAKIVRSGGRILYSVCTMTIEECEENARFAVEKLGLRLERGGPFLGSHGIVRELWGAEETQRFHPHLHDAGYYIALFRKP